MSADGSRSPLREVQPSRNVGSANSQSKSDAGSVLGTNAPAQLALDVSAASQTRKGTKRAASGNKSPARKDSGKPADAKKTQDKNTTKEEECSSQPWADEEEVLELLQLVGKARRGGRLSKMGKASVSRNPGAFDLFSGFSLHSSFVQEQHSTYMSLCIYAGEVHPDRHSNQQVLP